MGGPLRILGVDGETEYRDLYRGWLGADHDVETVPDGKQALEAVSEETDVVLLGRDLDGLNGRDVAGQIDEMTHDCHVVMVSSDPADFDIVNYPIDCYVRKPLDRSDLDGIIEQYETQRQYQTALEEYFRLTSKLGAIEAELSEREVEGSERYERLRNRVEEKRAVVDEAISAGETDWNVAFKSCTNPARTDIGSQF